MPCPALRLFILGILVLPALLHAQLQLSFTEFPTSGPPWSIIAGPDGALWFTEAESAKIGRITTAGMITEFPIPQANADPTAITTGADGALWFSLLFGAVGRITTAGVFTIYPVPNANPFVDGAVLAPDGAVWFLADISSVGRITTAGVITQYPLPFISRGLALGPDGALWFLSLLSSDGATSIGRITTAGAITQYPIQTINSRATYSALTTITRGPDGALWITDADGKIGRAAISLVPHPTISGPSPPFGQVGLLYSGSLNAIGGAPPYNNWTVSGGSLPAGLALDPFTGEVTGIPTSAGTSNFSVTVQDSAGSTSAPQIVSISINSIFSLSLVGSMPHIAAKENWITTFTLVNKSVTPAMAQLNLFGDLGGSLPLVLTVPGALNSMLTASVDQTISGNASLIVQTAGPQTPPVQTGSTQLSSNGAIDGFAIFHHVLTQQETVVPMETRNASSYLLAFDNTGGVVLGVAVANTAAPPGNVGIMIRDDTGALIETGMIGVPASGHISFVLPAQFPLTANRRGTIEFDTPSGGQISVLGMRFTPPNNALTTIPALANVGRGGGSVAHIATGNGWQSTFVLVNTSLFTPAPFQLNFFADNGSPLALPIGFPQSAGGTTTVASSVSQTLAPGAMLLVQSAAPLSDPTPTIGSAQLTTTGNVTGFEIFRYNPNGQEAVVPFESRNASGYLLAFDNTAGTATGVAINNASSVTANVPVTIRDDAGNLLATDTLTLAPNGHAAFTLVTDKYPAVSNKRGTIEFDTPVGGQIGALAFRIPLAHTFTTLPALAK